MRPKDLVIRPRDLLVTPLACLVAREKWVLPNQLVKLQRGCRTRNLLVFALVSSKFLHLPVVCMEDADSLFTLRTAVKLDKV